MRIRRFDPLSCGKMVGGVYALLALIGGAIVSLISLLGFAVAPGGNGGIMALMFGVGAIVIFPIVYFIFGLIGGILSALFYNLIAGVLGGIEFEVENVRGVERM